MCLGGHLAYRCALDPRISSAICYFATDIHSSTLGKGKKDDSLARTKDIKGELVMIFGKMDNHVPPEGRDLIRKTLHEAGVTFSFYEPAWAQPRVGMMLHCRGFALKCSRNFSIGRSEVIWGPGAGVTWRWKMFAKLTDV
ncbi:hypothetical protein IG631_21412 [Alternaria alternata]|nr:hypothetical protein IG631_21412 [Alternaria alternata]